MIRDATKRSRHLLSFISYPEALDFRRRRVSALNRFSLRSPCSALPESLVVVGGRRSQGRGRRSGLLLFVFGDDAAAAMRTFPIALLKVGARVSDLFTTVLACYRDVLLF